MKILIVCSKNTGNIAPFILEQGDSLVRAGLTVDYYCVTGKGIFGYLNNLKTLKNKIKTFSPDIVHAHYGLSGLLANLQRKVPVVTTYHGSDVNDPKVFVLSKLVMKLSVHNIFVSDKNKVKAGLKSCFSVIPCGVDTEIFQPMDKSEARGKLGWELNHLIILFSGAFSNQVKNPKLAIKSVRSLENAQLIQLKGYSRQEVSIMLNAADIALMTSFTEGSPQFIKEAMACNCPIVSTPVGDVQELIHNVEACRITGYEEDIVVRDLELVLASGTRTTGRKIILDRRLDLKSVAEKLERVYLQILKS